MSSVGPVSGPVSPQVTRASSVTPGAGLQQNLNPPLMPSVTLRLDYPPRDPAVHRAAEPIVPWVTDTLLQHRKLLLALAMIPLVISFNGRWRIGLDSSIYRGLARSIAAGKGYHFGEFGTHQVYPGLPVLLAGLTRLFGDNIYRPVATIVLMLIMSVTTLAVIHRLIARQFPQWMALLVTIGVAVNSWFVRLSHDVLTDIPFLLGAMAGLLGWDLLQSAQTPRQRIKATWLMVSGLALAAVMRPTFWILCLALLCVWVGGLIRGFIKGGWKLYACCLGVLILLCAGFWAIDPRTGPMHPFSGGYEAEMLEALQDGKAPEMDGDNISQPLRIRIAHEVTRLFTSHLAATFLGQELPWYANLVLSVALVGSTFLLARRQPVWAMFIFLTVCITVMLSTAPRYYVMILPFLLLGALLLLSRIGRRVGGGWHDAIVGIGFVVILAINISKIAPFVFEQQRVPFYEAGMRFYDKYRGGKFVPMIHLAALVQEKVPAGARLITPSAQIVRYLSDREVMMERELLPARKTVRHYPERLASMQIAYAAFPSRIYVDKEPMLAQLFKHGVVQAGSRLGAVDGIRLAEAKVVVPMGDWTKSAAPTSKPATKPAKSAKKKVKSTTRPTTRALVAKKRAAATQKAAKALRLRKLKRQSTTQGSKATTRRTKKKKTPATHPASPSIPPAVAR